MKYDDLKQTNEHRLYHKLAKFIFGWIEEENKKGIKPFQSEIIGALEMVKVDLYMFQSSERILSKRLVDIFGKLEGKEMSISKDGITIMKKEVDVCPCEHEKKCESWSHDK